MPAATDELGVLDAALISAGILERLSTAPEDARTWTDCDLASLVENRFFHRIDPRSLDERGRSTWIARATSPSERLADPRAQTWFRRPYWLLDEGHRAGTVALHPHTMDDGFLGVSSLFVFPDRRRRGIARRALAVLDEAARTEDQEGLRISTHWAWQAAARFYLFGLGAWVKNWKKALVFAFRSAAPRHSIVVDGRAARFDAGGSRLIEAASEGERLRWVETLDLKRLERAAPDRACEVRQTFAVALALHGFPLVRSGKHWRARRTFADGGTPEGLAHKIRLFEGWDRKCGFEIRTPRIPGLRYGASPE